MIMLLLTQCSDPLRKYYKLRSVVSLIIVCIWGLNKNCLAENEQMWYVYCFKVQFPYRSVYIAEYRLGTAD